MPLPSPVQPLRCGNPDCNLPEGGRCARLSEFPEPLADCPDLARETKSSSETPATTAPWSGRHLDPVEAERLLWRTPARLVGVLGPYNAGKTCLMTSFFLQLANGQRGAFPYRFASSLTLHGFRELMEHAGRWGGGKGEDRIVPHTTVGADTNKPRHFLHVGLRPKDLRDDRHIDLLLSDLPGEWVKGWTGYDDATSSERMSFVRRCDAFILLADASALMAQGGGVIDDETALLIRRLLEATQDVHPRPPLALVLSKFDGIIQSIEPPPSEKRTERSAWGTLGKRLRHTWPALEEARRAGVSIEVFPVSAFPCPLNQGQPIGVLDPFTYVMKHADSRERWPPLEVPIPEAARGFATMRRWRDEHEHTA